MIKRQGAIKSFFLKLANSSFFFVALLFVVLGAGFYYGLGSNATNALVEQILHRQQASARAGASAVATFFGLVGNSVAIISTRDEIINPSDETDVFLNRFIAQWEGTPVTALILTDEEGLVIKAAYSDVAGVTGVSIEDREYFDWVREPHEEKYRVSVPTLSRLRGESYYVVPVVSRVEDKAGNFKGAVVVGVSIDKLAGDYMEGLKISDKTEIYIVKSNGTLIYAPYKELLGVNLFDFVRERPFLGSEVLLKQVEERIGEDRREGKVRIAYPENILSSSKITPRLIAYTHVPLEDRQWTLAVSTPLSDSLMFLAPIYGRQMAGFVLVFLGVLVLAIRLAKTIAYREILKQNRTKTSEKDSKNP